MTSSDFSCPSGYCAILRPLRGFLAAMLLVTFSLFPQGGQGETVLILAPGEGFRVSNADLFSGAPRIEYIGDTGNAAVHTDDVRWGIVWADERLINNQPGRAVFYRAINPYIFSQFPERWISDLLTIGSINVLGEPDLAWNGSRLGVLYNFRNNIDQSELLFARLRPDGTIDSYVDKTALTGPPTGFDYGRPRVDNDGSVFGVFWAANRTAAYRETYYVELSTSGGINEDVEWASGGAPVGSVLGGDMLTLPGSDYAVVWPHFEAGNPTNPDYELYYARLDDNNGIERSNRLTYTTEHSINPQIAWDGGSRIAVVWDEFPADSDYIDVFFLLITTNGDPLMNDPLNLSLINTDSLFPTVAWTGEYWIVVWQEGQEGSEDLIFMVLNPDGSIRQEAQLLMDPIAPQTGLQRPHLAWDGQGQGRWTLGMTFQARLTSSNTEIYFVEIWPDLTAWMLR